MTTPDFKADLAARYQAVRSTVIDALGADAVALLDHPDLVKVGDLADIDDEDHRDEAVAARTTFAWIVRLEVCGTWVADGFELDDDRALDMLAHDLTLANIGDELGARVIAAPPVDLVARTQGYRDAADREARERKEQHDDEVADSRSY